jgi:hypothetical protein
MSRNEYVERLTRWLMPDRDDPELAAQARERASLDGVYTGKSARIQRLIRLAYLRGVRRGAGCAWEAKQPFSLRDAADDATPSPKAVTIHNLSDEEIRSVIEAWVRTGELMEADGEPISAYVCDRVRAEMAATRSKAGES